MKYTFVLRRLLSVVPVLLIITFATFFLMQLLPGGPLAAYENNPEISQKDIERLRHEMGLDRPIHVQYWSWLNKFMYGDWGYSFTTKRPVLSEIWDRLPNTLDLTGISLIVALIIAIPGGDHLGHPAILCFRPHHHDPRLHRPVHAGVLFRAALDHHLQHLAPVASERRHADPRQGVFGYRQPAPLVSAGAAAFRR